nr:hypothetical protein B0A51_04769 [Rachicladosporium sp. CCFEE 5018]
MDQGAATKYVMQNFPPDTHLTLWLLPTSQLDKEPLYELVRGFEMDLNFSGTSATSPMKTESDLDLYSARVAGTVALLCIQLCLYHYPGTSDSKAKRLMAAGHDMGIALQYTNIAHDLSVDVREHGRVYVPAAWLKKEKLLPETLVTALKADKPDDFLLKKIGTIRQRLLDRSFDSYGRSVGAIEQLPREARAPMRVAVESYMQLARELQTPGFKVKAGRATVPLWKRVAVAWRALIGPRERG